MAFEKYVLPDDIESPKLELHLFRAILQEKIQGQKTNAECLSALEAQLGVSLSQPEINDLTTLLTQINGAGTTPEKRNIADTWYRVFILAQSGCGWYDTKAKLKTRLTLE